MTFNFCGWLLLIFFVTGCQESFTQNLALNKNYRFSVPPNYGLTDGDDRSNLTDGYKREGPHFWQKTSTVGWNGIDEVAIDFDLEESFSISKIVINTSRGKNAGVYFPQFGFVFISEDGRNYKYIGDLMTNMENVPGDYKITQFSLSHIQRKGRYVKLLLIPNGKYLFLDEIEIFGGNQNDSNTKRGGAEKTFFLQSDNKFKPEKIQELQSLSFLHREKIKQAFQQKSNLGKAASSVNELRYISLNKLDSIIAKNRQIIREQEDVERQLPIYQLNTWGEWSNEAEESEGVVSVLNYDFTLFNGSSGYGAFRIVNKTDHTQHIRFKAECAEYENIELLWFWVDLVPNTSFLNLYDALIPLSEKNELLLSSGKNKIIFFKLKGINPGVEKVKIKIENEESQKQIEIQTNIVDHNTQGEKQFNANVWAYLYYPFFRGREHRAAQDLTAHGINTIVVTSHLIPKIGDSNFSELKEYLKTFPNLEHKKLLLFTNQSHVYQRNSERNEEYLSKPWKFTFKAWYGSLLRTLNSIGVDSDQVYYYPYDEIKPEQVDDFIALAEWSRTAMEELQFFITISDRKTMQVIPYSDINQVFVPIATEAKETYPKANIWVYDVIANAREESPYQTYRLMAWKAFLNDFNGIGFWNYAALGSQVKNNRYDRPFFDKKNDYSVVYTDKDENLLASRRWEAFSRGIEDYKVLSVYAEKYGQKETKKMVDNVLKKPCDATLADKTIHLILNKIKE